MLDGVMLLWFLLAAASLLFVAVDIRTTPESPVMKWGFVLLTAYTGVVGAFLYVLGCREPLPGTHEQYTAAQWRQTLGSTMHCVAGDGVGILAGAVISSILGITGIAEMILEYVLGFAFGWTIFQALFMRDLAGGTYLAALKSTFMAELLSMNLLMAGMMPTMMILVRDVDGAARRIHHRLPDELVAGGEPSQARHDDRPPRDCQRGKHERYGGRGAVHVSHVDANGDGPRAPATDRGDGAAVVPCPCGGPGDRRPAVGAMSAIRARRAYGHDPR
jgi:hypothetical protein